MEQKYIILIVIVLLIIIVLYYSFTENFKETFTSVYDQISGNCNYLIIPDSTSNVPSMDPTNSRNMCINCDGCGVCSNQLGNKNISECVKGSETGPSDPRIFCKSYQYKSNQPVISSSPTPSNNFFYGDKSKRINNYCSK